MKKTIGVLTAVIASAVVSCASPGRALPDTPNAPTAPAALQLEPARLPLNLLAPMNFQVKDGFLTLTAPFSGFFSGTKRPPDPVFWSEPYTGGPRQFTLAATDQDETLQDEHGQIIWSRHFGKPGLTLTMNPGRKAVLTDVQGKVLWQGYFVYAPYTPSSVSKNPFPQDPGPHMSARSNEVQYRCTAQYAELADDSGNILWSGHPDGNTHLLIRRPQGQDLIGMQDSFPLPPQNTTFHFMVLSEPWTATLSDQQHKAIAQGQLLSMSIQVSSETVEPNVSASVRQPGSPPDMQRLQDIVPPSPGIYFADYHDAQGNLIQSEKISVVEKRQNLFHRADSETIREISRIGYDNLGHLKFHAFDGALVPKSAPASASNLTKT